MFYSTHILHRTGQSKLLPTSSVVSATFKREKKVLIQMAVLVLGFIFCWLPFWILFSAFQICISQGYQVENECTDSYEKVGLMARSTNMKTFIRDILKCVNYFSATFNK